MNKPILMFDLGGVIEQHNFDDMAKYVSNKYNVNSDLFHGVMLKYLRMNDKCSINDGTLIKKINLDTGLNLTYEEFYNIYFKFVKTNYKMTDFLERLSAGGYRLALFSNTRHRHLRESEKRCNFKEVFDWIFISQMFGTRKPELKYYKLVLKKMGVKAENCIFIDDKNRNREPADKLGIKFILYKGSLVKLRNELIKYGVQVPKNVKLKGICKAHIHKI